ncbi:MAG: hypothetical protein ACKO5E_16755 [bacterium]
MQERQNRDRLILFALHSETFWWRLGWRLNQPGFSAQKLFLNSDRPSTGHRETPQASLLLIDLGWTEPELTTAMQFLLDFRKVHPAMPACVLVPRLQPESRPGWAELGVGLVLDRATAPPVIAKTLFSWLS